MFKEGNRDCDFDREDFDLDFDFDEFDRDEVLDELFPTEPVCERELPVLPLEILPDDERDIWEDLEGEDVRPVLDALEDDVRVLPVDPVRLRDIEPL